jgi:hypothetical protein
MADHIGSAPVVAEATRSNSALRYVLHCSLCLVFSLQSITCFGNNTDQDLDQETYRTSRKSSEISPR